MRVAEFSLLVRPGRELDSGHVALEHGKPYKLELKSSTWLRADADVWVDGKQITTVRLNGHGSVTIEGPPDDPAHGKFTFFTAGTAEAEAVGEGDITKDDKGLIKVVFRPEKRVEYPEPRPCAVRPMGSGTKGPQWSSGEPQYGTLRSAGGGEVTKSCFNMSEMAAEAESRSGVAPEGATAGVTGVSGYTDQRWDTVGPLPAYDEDKVVTISLRLVALKDGPRPLKARNPRESGVPAPASGG